MFRSSAMLAVLLSSLLLVVAPGHAQAASDCSDVTFLGLHGLGEGSENGTPRSSDWGSTIDGIWTRFHKQVPDAEAKSVEYPRTNATWENVGKFQPATQTAATQLAVQIISLRYTCADTKIVIAGYSQGAWAVDMALRHLADSPYEFNRLALTNVVGVYLDGDPARPYQGERAGLATRANMGYATVADYVRNGLPDGRFLSDCVSYGDGRFDPICLASAEDVATIYPERDPYKRNLTVHFEYVANGAAQRGADFLARSVR